MYVMRASAQELDNDHQNTLAEQDILKEQLVNSWKKIEVTEVEVKGEG